jgi:hypothetical protein
LQQQQQEPSKSHPFACSGSRGSSRSAASSAADSTGDGSGRVRQGGRTPHSNKHPPPATTAVSVVAGASHRSGLRSILTKNSDEGGAKSKDAGAANGKRSVKCSAKTDPQRWRGTSERKPTALPQRPQNGILHPRRFYK